MIEIDLLPGDADVFLIIKSTTNVRYINQSGGHACEQRACEGFIVPSSCEGFIVPIDNYIINDCELLHALWDGNSTEISEKHKEKMIRLNAVPFLNSFLNSLTSELSIPGTLLKELMIDESRLDELIEAWWPIKGKILSNGKLKYNGYEIDLNSLETPAELFLPAGLFLNEEIIKNEENEKYIDFTGYLAKENCD